MASAGNSLTPDDHFVEVQGTGQILGSRITRSSLICKGMRGNWDVS